MIKIDFENKKKEMEKIFWDWFYNHHLEEFRQILEKDDTLQELIFEDKNEYSQCNKEEFKYTEIYYEPLKNFFFSLPQKHFEYRERMKGRGINSQSKQFFLARYVNLRHSQMPKIINLLDIHSCPYCNRNFIDVYYTKKSTKPNRFNGDIDHYFPKSEYEYLALCLYNLIPSCKTCNHEKNSQNGEHFHPYMNNHEGMYWFETNFNIESNEIDIDYLYGLSEKFEIELQTCDEYKSIVEASNEMFHLNHKYKKMTSFAKNIIRKAYIYNNEYLKDFIEQYENILDEKEVIKIIFDYEEGNFLNKPLSKLKYDLMKEFDVI